MFITLTKSLIVTFEFHASHLAFCCQGGATKKLSLAMRGVDFKIRLNIYFRFEIKMLELIYLQQVKQESKNEK